MLISFVSMPPRNKRQKLAIIQGRQRNGTFSTKAGTIPTFPVFLKCSPSHLAVNEQVLSQTVSLAVNPLLIIMSSDSESESDSETTFNHQEEDFQSMAGSSRRAKTVNDALHWKVGADQGRRVHDGCSEENMYVFLQTFICMKY